MTPLVSSNFAYSLMIVIYPIRDDKAYEISIVLIDWMFVA